MTTQTQQTTMTVDQAEAVLDFWSTRENAQMNGEAREWDEAYRIAFDAYLDASNLHINGVPA